MVPNVELQSLFFCNITFPIWTKLRYDLPKLILIPTTVRSNPLFSSIFLYLIICSENNPSINKSTTKWPPLQQKIGCQRFYLTASSRALPFPKSNSTLLNSLYRSYPVTVWIDIPTYKLYKRAHRNLEQIFSSCIYQILLSLTHHGLILDLSQTDADGMVLVLII